MANPVADVALEDLTARARIRDAALVLFAERGTKSATVRDIAKAAGVSGGLLRHHFGPKDGLRDTCDSYVLDKIMRLKERAVLEGELANPAFMSAAQPEMLLLYRYLARSMIDGSPQAASMFDEMVALGEKWLERNNPGQMVDPRAYAALLVAMELGALSLHEQLSRALGADIFSQEGHLRLATAKVDFYSKPLLGPKLAAHAHAAIKQLQARSPEPGRAPAKHKSARGKAGAARKKVP
ncbi:MAG TPA: TetR family transcriptional regulator [Acidimicrobiales bacterium]|nr:TetR family transcriptional regulator [Acidimicrobiales bacterium]